jgi:hypothetical protein
MPNRDIRFGPYAPPGVDLGDEIQCEIRGLITVHSWSDRGAIMWPMGLRSGASPGRPAMILTGDLVRALRRESAIAVANHWGTTWRTVRVWRRALGIGRMTEGSTLLASEVGELSDVAQYAYEGQAASMASRKRRDAAHAATLRAKAGWPEHMKALSRKRWRKDA